MTTVFNSQNVLSKTNIQYNGGGEIKKEPENDTVICRKELPVCQGENWLKLWLMCLKIQDLGLLHHQSKYK
jgi:hypothetical protein